MYHRALIVVSRGQQIAVFQEITIRRVWHNEEWCFDIVDVVGALTDSVQPEGDPQAWIEKRLRSISVRGELTDEWKARGVAEGKEYSILTAEIAPITGSCLSTTTVALGSAHACGHIALRQARLAFAFGHQFTVQRALRALAPSARTGTGPPPFHAPKVFCAEISNSS